MKRVNELSIAIRIASQAFENKTDRGGKPYILHCLYVMYKVKHLGELAMIVAILHDVVEDCEKEGYTYSYLLNEGISITAISFITLLTHVEGVPYMDYIKNLSCSEITKEIKKADLEHNSKIARLKGLRKKDFERIEKYHIAYEYLS